MGYLVRSASEGHGGDPSAISDRVGASKRETVGTATFPTENRYERKTGGIKGFIDPGDAPKMEPFKPPRILPFPDERRGRETSVIDLSNKEMTKTTQVPPEERRGRSRRRSVSEIAEEVGSSIRKASRDVYDAFTTLRRRRSSSRDRLEKAVARSVSPIHRHYPPVDPEEREIDMLRDAVEVSKKKRGENHPFTLERMDHLAEVLKSRRKYEEAEQWLQLSTKLSKETLGLDHPTTLERIYKLTEVLLNQNKSEEAKISAVDFLSVKEGSNGNVL